MTTPRKLIIRFNHSDPRFADKTFQREMTGDKIAFFNAKTFLYLKGLKPQEHPRQEQEEFKDIPETTKVMRIQCDNGYLYLKNNKLFYAHDDVYGSGDNLYGIGFSVALSTVLTQIQALGKFSGEQVVEVAAKREPLYPFWSLQEALNDYFGDMPCVGISVSQAFMLVNLPSDTLAKFRVNLHGYRDPETQRPFKYGQSFLRFQALSMEEAKDIGYNIRIPISDASTLKNTGTPPLDQADGFLENIARPRHAAPFKGAFGAFSIRRKIFEDKEIELPPQVDLYAAGTTAVKGVDFYDEIQAEPAPEPVAAPSPSTSTVSNRGKLILGELLLAGLAISIGDVAYVPALALGLVLLLFYRRREPETTYRSNPPMVMWPGARPSEPHSAANSGLEATPPAPQSGAAKAAGQGAAPGANSNSALVKKHP